MSIINQVNKKLETAKVNLKRNHSGMATLHNASGYLGNVWIDDNKEEIFFVSGGSKKFDCGDIENIRSVLFLANQIRSDLKNSGKKVIF